MGKHTASRHETNTYDTKFHLRFLERLYDGSPRWWNPHWENRYVSRVAGDNFGTLNREPGVASLIYMAHDSKQFYNSGIPFLEACVNPTCPLRSWTSVYFRGSGYAEDVRDENNIQSGQFPNAAARESAWNNVERGLKHMAHGKWGELQDQCPQCQHKQPVFAITPISNKWVYVLKESGQSLTPYLQIFVQSEASGHVYTKFREGRFQADGHPFDGKLILDKIESNIWHFFLSPVKLGPQALKLLSRAPKEDPQYAQRRDAIKPADYNVGVIADLQPWTATVKRRFQARQTKTPFEYIPLVDPVAWAAEIADFDYLPVLAAQQKLIQDSDEQAKGFVASTLAQVIGQRKVSDNPPKWVVEDKWDVRGETVDVPAEYSSSGNIAQAWVDRYQSTLEYLTTETNYACSRLWFPVRFSLAHRIVEMACQETKDDSDLMSFGLTHWVHILREMLACQSGEAFTTWLASNNEAGDRIPQKNVLGGADLGPGSPLRKAIGPSLPLHILAHLSAVIIANNDHPATVLKEHLEKIDVHATKFGVKEALSLRDLPMTIAGDQLDKYVKSLPEVLDPKKIHAASIAISWQERIQTFTQIKQVEEAFTLLTEVAEYGKKKERTDSEWERNAYKEKDGVSEKVKEKIEAPVKVAKFLGEQTHKIMKATVLSGETEKEIIEKLETKGLGKGLQALTAEEAELFTASRSLATFRWVGVGLRVLAGPVGMVIGGCELVIQGKEMVHSLEAGDPGAAIAHGLQAAAAALIIVVAGAECVALVTGAGIAAWAGPVGWIAAGLMLIGGIVMAWCAKNDLELYARHCFLGVDYGNGEFDKTGKAWMGSWGWAELRYKNASLAEAPGRWSRQRVALLRMLTGYETWIGYSTYAGGVIFPTYVPAGAYFEIELDDMPKGSETPKETYRAVIWPGVPDFEWRGTSPGYGSGVKIYSYGGRITAIDIVAKPIAFGTPIDYNLRVRLLLDASGKNRLPVTAKWVKNSTIDMFEYSQVSSSEADSSTEEKEEGKQGEGEGSAGE